MAVVVVKASEVPRERLLEMAGWRGPAPVFPHPHLSISHSGPFMAAAFFDLPGVVGTGVDLETAAAPKREAARFFLHEPELGDATPVTLLRLWTVKEALFKATPDNDGLSLLHWTLDDPAAWGGTARGGVLRAQYATRRFGNGFLTSAVAFHGG